MNDETTKFIFGLFLSITMIGVMFGMLSLFRLPPIEKKVNPIVQAVIQNIKDDPMAWTFDPGYEYKPSSWFNQEKNIAISYNNLGCPCSLYAPMYINPSRKEVDLLKTAIQNMSIYKLKH